MHADQLIIFVTLGTLLNMLLGAIWYSPLLFGKYWMKLMNIKKQEFDAVGLTYFFTFCASICVSLAVYYIFLQFSLSSGKEIFMLSWSLWLAFCAATLLPQNLYEDRDLRLYFLYSGYQLGTFTLYGLIWLLI